MISKGKILLLAVFLAAAGCSDDGKSPERKETQNMRDFKAINNYRARFQSFLKTSGAELAVSNWDFAAGNGQYRPKSESLIEQIEDIKTETVLPLLERYKKFQKTHLPVSSCEAMKRSLAMEPNGVDDKVFEIVFSPVQKKIDMFLLMLHYHIELAAEDIDNTRYTDEHNKQQLARIAERFDLLERKLLPEWKSELAPAQAELKKVAALLLQKRELMRANAYLCKQALPDAALKP